MAVSLWTRLVCYHRDKPSTLQHCCEKFLASQAKPVTGTNRSFAVFSWPVYSKHQELEVAASRNETGLQTNNLQDIPGNGSTVPAPSASGRAFCFVAFLRLSLQCQSWIAAGCKRLLGTHVMQCSEVCGASMLQCQLVDARDAKIGLG